jgi:lambda family phage minor tail protein L
MGARITLYVLDLTMFDLGVIHMTPTSENARAVSFGGEVYSPHPVDATGFELTTTGSLPRPTLAVANLDNSFTAMVELNDDLQGAILTRLRTFARYLDDGAEPDGNVHLPPDVYMLSQKTAHTQSQIEWQCAALMDQEGVQLPGRQVTRDYCDHVVRRWTGTTFDYANATCPYVGAPLDENGKPCDASAEVFSKRLDTCCKARFGATSVLPTRAFPGVARLANR